MMLLRRVFGLSTVLALSMASLAAAQSPSVLYTWDNTGNASPNIEQWVRSFGAANTSATLTNATLGSLTITETSATLGGSQAFNDNGNRVRESSTGSSGGTDLTGLDFLEFDLGHNGAGNINVQFYVQATTASTFVALGPDLSVAPGMATYQVPITALTPAQAVYVRTMGFNVRDHAALGNVTWTLNEVRSGGTPLSVRDLITHDDIAIEGGLQGARANFDQAAIQGNDGGQNQTGLSHNPSGSGSLQWTDLGGSNGAAIVWGNGTAWGGNSFNNRPMDVSNYKEMVVTMSATDPAGGGGVLGVQGFFQRNNFVFEGAEGGVLKDLPIDGQFHNLRFSIVGNTLLNVAETVGINLASHQQNLVINVDRIRFVPEPTTGLLLGMGAVLGFGFTRRGNRRSL